MLVTGHAHAVMNPPRTKIKCGSWLWIVAKKPYRRQHHCNTWKCQDGICQGRLTEQLQAEIRSTAGATVAITDVTRARSAKDDKWMSNFFTRHVTGKFWKVLSNDRCILISTSDYPGSVRRFTKKVIDTLLPEILLEPWTPPADKKIRRVTRRRGQRKPNEKNRDKAYGLWLTRDDPEQPTRATAFTELVALQTDYARAEWVFRYSAHMRLYNRGKKMVADHLNTTATAGR
jgi:hypothetical protein